MGNYSRAEEYFTKGLKIVPNYINILNNLGNLKRDLDLTDEALNYYKKSLMINPNVIESLLNISICYQSLGNFDESKKYLNNLLKLDIKFTTADRLIASMTKYNSESLHLKEMLKKSDEVKLNDIQSANLFFGIAKAYEDLKEYDQCFQNYNKGNILLKKLSNFNINNEIDSFENIKKFFLNNLRDISKKKSRKLIFIVGMPRSGTSLIEQILSSHNNVYGGGELTFLKKIIENKFLNNSENKTYEIVKNTDTLFQEAHEEYITQISLINNSNKTFIDKAPLNFKYIGFIKKIFPNSKIINCKRDSLDVCWSNFKNYFDGLPFTNDLIDIANFYNIYDDLIEFWHNKFPREIYEMNYNYLIADPEKEIRKLLEFCELDWDPNCMKHEKNNKTIKTASSSQARQPINKGGLRTSEPFMKYLNKVMEIIKN